ncbi:heat shock protein [Humitalea rosea]|uniref:Heat shock protein n=1 Tax=Humitalea rosea TaxID=990373 RepID=A0A2W7IW07_9PROT|nr:M48 family metallopeptidase [Humitalea rosea]PZW50457.1 heat shock protein [Humitalea rosea]
MLTATGLQSWSWNTAARGWALLAGFPVLLTMAGFGLVLILGGGGNGKGSADSFAVAWNALPAIFVVSLVAAGIWFLIAWALHQWMLDRMTGSHAVTRLEEPRLWNAMEVLCISRGLPMPRLAIIETEARNAFASGLARDRGSVSVTRGLLDSLDDRELSAVLAHEVTHLRNGDARLGVIAAVFAGILSLLAEIIGRGIRFRAMGGGGQRRNNNGGAVIVGVVLIIVAGVLGALLRMALSRNREYLADAGSVALTQDPDAMITALRKVAGHSNIEALPQQVQAMMLDWPAGEAGAGFWATHPSIEQRITALVAYGGGRTVEAVPPPA